MSIQIIGLRDFYDKRKQKLSKKEAFFEKKWRAESVPYLFKNIDKFIKQIPETERYNVYYTAASCLESRGRKLASQSIIPIDIDDIDTEKLEEYIQVTLDALGTKYDETGIVFSGNGLQFIIAIDEPILDEEYFEEYRPFYKALCGKISQELFNHGLKSHVDSSVFSPARLLRLPNTINKKPEKGEKQARLIQGNITTISFNLKERSGMPVIEYNEQMSDKMLERLPPPDTQGVLNGCDFIKYCRDNSDSVTEPQWYALLSILGRLENGRELSHEFSRGHPSYSPGETDSKIQQAMQASGPRTCDNISQLWDGCGGCINFQKCKSPIVIQSAEYIKTKDTGFHNIVIDGNGIKKGKPNYQDLMKYFEQQHPFITIADSNITYIWEQNHWEDYAPKSIDSFAERHFDPSPNNTICNEFRGKIQRNNLRNGNWFDTQGFINFNNGYLNLENNELSSHTSDMGFRYVLPFDYDPSLRCPRFERFLREITCNDEGLARVLLEFMGYSLSGIDPAIGQKALLLVGSGSNGKSVFMDLLKYLAGKGNYATLSMGNEINRLENRYQLDGKLFNISEETPTNAMMDSTVFKALVTGGEVQARKLYCDAYSMKNNAKIIMACNELPSTRDLSHGMFRRLLIVPFNATFDKSIEGYDPFIRDKLYEEAPGIFNLVLKSLNEFRRRKMFADSQTIDRQVEAYKRSNDDVQDWWDCSVVTSDSEVSLTDMYTMYKIDAESSGLKPKNMVWFSRRIRQLVNDDSRFRRARKDGKLQAFVKGYAVSDSSEDF